MISFWSYLIVFLMSAVPVIELKGSIPVGIEMGIPEWECFLLGIFGSMILSPLIITLTRRILEAFINSKIKLLNRFGTWQHTRLVKKGGRIKKYSVWFLLLFVAIPLPTTGVWTGSMIAGLLDLRIKKAVPVIFLGNIIAGLLIWFIWGFASG